MREDLTWWILVGFFAFVLPLVGLLWFLLRTPTSARGTAAQDVAAEFRQRRTRSWRYGFPAAFGGLAMFMFASWLLVEAERPGLLGSAALACVLGFFGLVLFGVGRSYLADVYRCPACGDEVADRDGWILAPRVCPACGAPLR